MFRGTWSAMVIEEDAAIFLGDGFERAFDEIPAIASGRAEDVARQAVRMDADERGRIAFEFTADERDVLVVVDIARVSNHAEIAKARRQNRFSEAADVAFMLHAIANQIRDGEQL